MIMDENEQKVAIFTDFLRRETFLKNLVLKVMSFRGVNDNGFKRYKDCRNSYIQ